MIICGQFFINSAKQQQNYGWCSNNTVFSNSVLSIPNFFHLSMHISKLKAWKHTRNNRFIFQPAAPDSGDMYVLKPIGGVIATPLLMALHSSVQLVTATSRKPHELPFLHIIICARTMNLTTQLEQPKKIPSSSARAHANALALVANVAY